MKTIMTVTEYAVVQKVPRPLALHQGRCVHILYGGRVIDYNPSRSWQPDWPLVGLKPQELEEKETPYVRAFMYPA